MIFSKEGGVRKKLVSDTVVKVKPKTLVLFYFFIWLNISESFGLRANLSKSKGVFKVKRAQVSTFDSGWLTLVTFKMVVVMKENPIGINCFPFQFWRMNFFRTLKSKMCWKFMLKSYPLIFFKKCKIFILPLAGVCQYHRIIQKSRPDPQRLSIKTGESYPERAWSWWLNGTIC